MPTVSIDDIGARVRAAIQDRSEALWLPRFTEPLARAAWDQLESEIGLTHASYGTARLVRRNPKEARRVVALCSAESNGGAFPGAGAIPVEILPPDVARQVTGPGIPFFCAQRVVGIISHQLEEALSFFDLVHTIWPTVCTLVRSLHIIDPGVDDTDVSYSDPTLPFSVFVSVPRTWSEVAALRVAESILHEAMHIQLTLVERVVPLVLPQRNEYYSPWRDEHRSSEGILQALFVFCVIRSFLKAIPLEPQPSPANEHVADRIAEIDCQIRQSQGFRGCDELTRDGAVLVARLLDIAD